MGECRDCAYSDRPIYKWPCDVCRDTKSGRSMYCPEETDHIANDERKTDYIIWEADGDDYVRRADIVEKFMDRLPSISVGYLCKIADEIPVADVRSVPPARWLNFKDESICSGCGAAHNGVYRNYCPNCGAKMGGNTMNMSMQEYLEAQAQRYDQLEDFAKYVANAVMRDDFSDETFAELFCRRLYKLGYICKIDDEWALMGGADNDQR